MRCFSIFEVFFISLCNVLVFSEQVFHILVKFIPSYFIVLEVILNGIDFASHYS